MSKKLLIPLFVLVLAIASVLLVSKLPEIKPSRDYEMEQLLGKLSEMGYDTGKIKYSDESLEILTLKLRENGTLRPLGPLGKIAILPPGRSSREERDCYTIPGYSVTCKEKEEGGTEITFGRSRKIEVNGIEFETKLSIVSWETKGTLRDGSQIRASLGLSFNEIREVLSLVLNEIPKYPEENKEETLKTLYYELSKRGYFPQIWGYSPGIQNPEVQSEGIITILIGHAIAPPETCYVIISREEFDPPIKGTKEILKSDSLGEIRVIRERFHYPPSLYSEIEVNETKLGAWISGIKANEEEIEKVLIILKEAAKDMKNCDEYITSEMKKLGYEKQLPGEILCEEEFEIFPFRKTEEEVRLAEAFDEFLRKTEFSFTYLWIIPGNKEEALKTARFRGPLIQALPPVRQVENCLSEKHIGEIEVGKSKAKVYYCTPQDEIGEAYFTLFEFEEDERVKTVICFSTNLKEMRKIIEEALRWGIKCLRNS
mgnify:CR=1 FL=1